MTEEIGFAEQETVVHALLASDPEGSPVLLKGKTVSFSVDMSPVNYNLSDTKT